MTFLAVFVCGVGLAGVLLAGLTLAACRLAGVVDREQEEWY